MESLDTGILIDKLDTISRSKNIILEVELAQGNSEPLRVSFARKNEGLTSKRMIDFEKKFIKSLNNAKAGGVFVQVPESEYSLKVTVFDAWKKNIFYSCNNLSLPVVDNGQMRKFIEIFFEKFPSSPATFKRL